MAHSNLGASVYETRTLLAWWTAQPEIDADPNLLPPVVAGLLLADSNPDAALESITHQLRLGQQSPELRLLAAWLTPQTSAMPHQPQPPPTDQPTDLYQILLGYPRFSRANAIRPYGLAFCESGLCDSDLVLDALLIEESLSIRPLRSWLTSIVTAPGEGYRGMLTFAYRNYQAKQITKILLPQHLNRYTLVAELNLFLPWPREWPALDRRIETLRTEALGLPHPTHNRFRLAQFNLD